MTDPTPSDPKHPEPVIIGQYPTEIQASFAMNALREAGIRCEMVGGASSGFKAESPGYVRLLVPETEVEKARQILADFDAEKADDDPADDPSDNED
ncbi:MAG: DUF2007 domain-containing protein [Phycisphaerales bacterium]|nr:DUF2007 domain-containing protein [Phycisphaerales bacterium]